MPPLPLVVTAFQNVIDPSQAGLRTDPLQTWITIQHAREDEIGDELRLYREASRWTHGLFLIAGVATPAWHGEPQTAAGMPVNGSIEILARRPQWIPVWVVKMFKALQVLAGLDQHHNAPVALLHGPLHFCHGDVNTAHIRNHRQRHIAITDFAPLRNRVIVGADAVQLELGIPLEERGTLHRVIGKEDLAVNPVFIKG